MNSVSFSPDGTTLAVGTSQEVKLWDMATRQIATLPHTAGVNSVSFSPDGATLAAGTIDGTVELWDTSELTQVRLEAIAEIVDIPDSNLRAAIATTFDKSPSAPIVRRNMAALNKLVADNLSISDLTGLELAINLMYLTLGENSVSDISAVAGLTKLTTLTLGENFVSDISALAGLTNLEELRFWGNAVSDISAVAGLTKLTLLQLSGNSISDISAVSNLTQLVELGLNNNSVSDLLPVVANLGLGEGCRVFLEGNPLNYPSIDTHIPTLKSRGVEITFDNRTPTSALKITGDQQGTPGAALTKPFVVEVRDANGSAFEGVPVTFTITAGGGTLSVTSTTTDENGRAKSTLTLGPNLETNSVSVSAAEIEKTVTFTAVAGERVIIPDSNLLAAVASTLGKASDAPITPRELVNLTRLVATNANIGDLTGLDHATNLTSLNLSHNSVSDISAVAGLAKLTGLTLNNNNISDISVLSGLTNLTWLGLYNNSVSDLSPLVANTGLGSGATVSLEGNSLSYSSIHTHIPTLQEREVEVYFDDQAHPALLKISGDNQVTAPGTAVANPFVVEALDENGSVIEGISVTFTVTAGGGTLSVTSTTTDENGRAKSNLTLGPNPGTNTVTVPVTGIQAEQMFTAEGIRIPKRLEIVSGKDQEGLPGAALENPFIVEVRDRADTPVPGVQVTFSVTSGGGTLSATSVTTNSNGRAESILTLGPNPGTNTVTVSVTGITQTETFNAEGIRIPLAFWIISGDDQQGLPGEALAKPFVVEVRDQSGDPLLGVQVTFSVTSGGGTLSVTSATTESGGRAESILTLGPNPGTNTVEVGVRGIQEKQSVSAMAELPAIPQDVNRDDVVNILDLVLVASDLGDEGADLMADVNGDGVVNILDLVLVAGAFGDVAAPASDTQALAMLTAADVGQWWAQAQTLDLPDTASREGVLVLEQLLAVLAPKETILLPNYPNPFNPETLDSVSVGRECKCHVDDS